MILTKKKKCQLYHLFPDDQNSATDTPPLEIALLDGALLEDTMCGVVVEATLL